MSGPITDKSGQIVKRPDAKQELTIIKMLASSEMQRQFALALPDHIKPERMLRVAITAIRRSADLQKCSVPSLLGSLLTSAQLGLEVNTPLGFAFLIPYKGECTLQIGYQGYLDMGRRSGLIATPMATLVYEGDDFEVVYGLYPDVRHKPSKDPERESKKITHVYAYAHAIPKDSAPPIFVVLTRAEVLKRKARSAAVKAGRTSPWDTDEGAMFKKTGIRALWPWIPKNVEMARAAELEDLSDHGRAQTVAWDPKTIDIMATEGITIEPETEVTEDGEIVGELPQETAGTVATEASGVTQPTEQRATVARKAETTAPPGPPPERKRAREPGED